LAQSWIPIGSIHIPRQRRSHAEVRQRGHPAALKRLGVRAISKKQIGSVFGDMPGVDIPIRWRLRRGRAAGQLNGLRFQPLAAALARLCSPGHRASVDDIGRGLRGRILPLFTKATGIEVHVVAQGTGQALETARRGDADLVLVHHPEAEQKFISGGHGIDRRQIAWNDCVIVGPDNDPARLKGGRDAVAAFKAIAAAKAPSVSGGDNSGTSALELRLWKSTGIARRAAFPSFGRNAKVKVSPEEPSGRVRS
jgi:hypothetical protein